MKRCFALLGAILFGMTLLTIPNEPAKSTCSDSSEVLRLHVLANSDSEADQEIKLAVRDAVLPLFSEQESYADARTFLLEHGKELHTAASDVLASYDVSYGVTLSLGTEQFPERTYGNTVYPEGRYDALCIKLGNASGQNWWCVLFPPLCLVTEEGAPVDLDEIEPKSSLWEWLCRLWEEYAE